MWDLVLQIGADGKTSLSQLFAPASLRARGKRHGSPLCTLLRALAFSILTQRVAWPTGSRCCCFGSRARSCYGSQSAGSRVYCSRNHRATPGGRLDACPVERYRGKHRFTQGFCFSMLGMTDPGACRCVQITPFQAML